MLIAFWNWGGKNTKTVGTFILWTLGEGSPGVGGAGGVDPGLCAAWKIHDLGLGTELESLVELECWAEDKGRASHMDPASPARMWQMKAVRTSWHNIGCHWAPCSG